MAIVRSEGVLFAKNSDRDPNEEQVLDWQPRQSHVSSQKLRCTWIEIPQIAETNAVLLSRPAWMWGAEMGTNEHGVTIGNEAVFTRQPYAVVGLTGMDLVRLALERASTAGQAVQTIVALIEQFGQGGGCGFENRRFTYHNSFIVADPRTAFVLETAGRHQAIEEIRGARSISNGLTIPGFAQQHADPIKTYVCGCRRRQARSQRLLRGAGGPGDLTRILRDHGEGHSAPRYSWLNGGLDAVCVHAGGLVAASQTTASWVAELRPGAVQHWATGTAAPCTSLFKPVAVDQPLTLSPGAAEAGSDHSLWWRHERLHRIVMRDPMRLGALYQGQRDEIETAWLSNPPDSCTAFAQADALENRWAAEVLSARARDTRPRFVSRYWARRDARAKVAEKGSSPETGGLKKGIIGQA